jgi:hypothetical protein
LLTLALPRRGRDEQRAKHAMAELGIVDLIVPE